MLLDRRLIFLVVLLALMLIVAICWAQRDTAWGRSIWSPDNRAKPPVQAVAAPSNPLAEAPVTRGEWRWQRTARMSSAVFADDLVTLTCDLNAGTVTISRLREGTAADAITILTSTQARTFRTNTLEGGVGVTLAGNHAILDALAFSRGRFGIQVEGLPAIYPASWVEVSRVIEDCRSLAP